MGFTAGFWVCGISKRNAKKMMEKHMGKRLENYVEATVAVYLRHQRNTFKYEYYQRQHYYPPCRACLPIAPTQTC